MLKLRDVVTFVRRQPRWRLGVAVAVVLVSVLLLVRGSVKSDANAPTFTARRGPLEITVLEGGSLQAVESQESKCEVRVGYQGTKILKIVEEGYLVTEDDVKNGKVLVELDSSDFQQRLVQQEVQYQSAVASLTDAQQNYEIQVNQNDSDIKAAEQKARFALMDFDRFLGDSVAQEIVARVGLDKLLAAASTNDVKLTTRAERAVTQPGSSTNPPPSAVPPANLVALVAAAGGTASDARPVAALPTASAPNQASDTKRNDDPPSPTFEMPQLQAIDFSKYATIEALGDGEAKQKVRKFDDDLQVARKELGQAQGTLEGTRRLRDKEYVTKTELQRDEIAFENSRLKVQTAETARDLFLKYEFPKSAEETLSKYADAVRELDKARRMAVSKLAQAEAKLNSAEAQHQVQLRQRNDLQDQIAKCIIRARKPGLVVYGSAGQEMIYYSDQERIREGATVRERQAIITIPDMTRMAVNVKIHETYIKKVKKGQKARITVDAYPDKVLEGEVTKVGVLPDSQNRYMNPDLKVYLTTVTINGTHDWAKPGMTAKVEILVNHLADVVQVPIQAVSPNGSKQVCYVTGAFKTDRREVETGEFNDEFIEIKKGLKEGERVLLRPARAVETETPGGERKPADNRGEEPPRENAPPPAPPQTGKS